MITPKDLEQTYGLTGGHIFHGELALDQLFTMRPLLNWAQYRTPIKNLYLCGSGTHPGIGLTGGSGGTLRESNCEQTQVRQKSLNRGFSRIFADVVNREVTFRLK